MSSTAADALRKLIAIIDSERIASELEELEAASMHADDEALLTADEAGEIAARIEDGPARQHDGSECPCNEEIAARVASEKHAPQGHDERRLAMLDARRALREKLGERIEQFKAVRSEAERVRDNGVLSRVDWLVDLANAALHGLRANPLDDEAEGWLRDVAFVQQRLTEIAQKATEKV